MEQNILQGSFFQNNALEKIYVGLLEKNQKNNDDQAIWIANLWYVPQPPKANIFITKISMDSLFYVTDF